MSSVNGKYLKISLIFFFVFTIGWTLGFMIPATEQFKQASNGMGMLDLTPQWNQHQMQTYLNDAGTAGRQIMVSIYQKEDFIFPLAYGPLLMLIMIWYGRKLKLSSKLIWLWVLLPLTTMAVDYWENFSALHLLKIYPNIDMVGSYLYMITLAKWSLVGMGVIVITTLLVGFLFKRYRLNKR
jgi:hypothetical protein